MGEGCFAEILIWRVPSPVPGSAHIFKYSLAFVVDGVCALRFDNEAGKGDHLHVGAIEKPYTFLGADRLMKDFWMEIDGWRPA